MPPRGDLARMLLDAGYTDAELHASNVRDPRLTGRICSAWRDEHGHVLTLWARSITNTNTERYR